MISYRKDEMITATEAVRNFSSVLSSISNKEKEKIGFRGIVRDITDKFNAQEALRKSERRYRTLLDFVPYPLVVFTLDGHVSYLNPAFTENFGWTLSELEGKTIPYVPPDLEQQTSENIKKLALPDATRRIADEVEKIVK